MFRNFFTKWYFFLTFGNFPFSLITFTETLWWWIAWIKMDPFHHWDIGNCPKKIGVSKECQILRNMVISLGDFSGAHLSFAKKGLFFDFFWFFLKNSCPNGSETLIFWKYIQFAIEWYIICLYMIKIEAFRFFSQKSTNCPIGRSSLFEPCHSLLHLSLVHTKNVKQKSD